MSSKKIFDILITFFIIGLLSFLIYQFIISKQSKTNEKELQKDNEELQEKIGYLENQIKDLINQNEILNNKINHQPETPEDNKTCTFTRTFHYTDTLDYKQVPEEKWVIFQAYQDHPFILRLENDFGTKFEKDVAYEITFTGLASNDGEDLSQYKIISIQKTNKVGMNQIQEPCRVEE